MRSRSCRGPVHVLAIFFFVVLLVSPAQSGHRWLLEVGSTSADDATAVNSTALDEGKVELIFCVLRLCPTNDACYCCMTKKPFFCYGTWDECKAKCNSCNPKCPPP
ncbi:unnamed protein product [Urochloa decumbens]|uniref:Bowman-Birk serine protease inhibitors family domain-containing protein n=1 Tax=Urochloa decumbens TaxID=240449 RepID=A0ABC8ZDY7_9POAL